MRRVSQWTSITNDVQTELGGEFDWLFEVDLDNDTKLGESVAATP
jgi:predicted component of type VI protein secretion system